MASSAVRNALLVFFLALAVILGTIRLLRGQGEEGIAVAWYTLAILCEIAWELNR